MALVRPYHRRMNRTGTTLIEISLAITLLLILASITIPQFGRVAARSELNLARIDLHRALDATRGAAVRLGQTMKLEAAGSLFVARNLILRSGRETRRVVISRLGRIR